MAFNLGAALGAAAQSGMSTYLKLGEEQRQEEELAMRRKEAAYQEELRQQERELNKITALTLGAGDKRTVADQSTVNPAYEGMDAPAATGYKEVAYTPQQQMADFKQRALAAGVPLQKVTGVASAHRAEKYAENEEMALDFGNTFRNAMMDAAQNNKGDLSPVVEKYFQPLYNEGKLPGLDDGKTMKIVPSGTGSGKSIVTYDGKGKVVKTYDLDHNTVAAIGQKMQSAMMRDANPANWWKTRETDLKEREVAAKEGELGVHKEFYGRGGTYERVAGQRAGGGDKSIKAKAGEYAEALVDAKAINPTTKKPYTVEEAKQYALGVVLKDPNAKTKSEWKAVSGNPDLQENAEGVQREWNATTNTWKIRGVPEVSANGSKLGVVADIRDGQVGYKGKGGWYSTEQEAVESFSTSATSDKAPPQASALPTGTRAELRASADKIDAEIAALRHSVTVKTPIQERTAIGNQISALQAKRSDTLKAWAKTPGVGIDSGAAYPVPRP